MKRTNLISIGFLAVALSGCGTKTQQAWKGPVKGTDNLEGLTAQQKIDKVQNDKSIPDNYKQTYINSVKSQSTSGQR